MRLEIWCKEEYGPPKTKRVLARVVVWDVVPQVGDCIIVWNGFCSEKVLEVHHSFNDKACYIEINPDYNGEYAKMASSLQSISNKKLNTSGGIR